jgi:hypothetical protein
VPLERPYDADYSHEVITIGSPAVATGFTHVVPGASRQRASRLVRARGRRERREPDRARGVPERGRRGVLRVAAPFTVTANITSRLNFGIGIQQFGANAAAQIGAGLPAFKLNAGLAIRVAVTAIQAGDQISGASLFVDQWAVRD